MGALTGLLGQHLELPVDRTAGDEIQLVLTTPAAALSAILWLTRTGAWSVGCGVGTVNEPLGASSRESTGPAFFAARDAVDAAKKKDTRFALRSFELAANVAASPIGSADGEALINLLLLQRARRSDEGWALYDLMAAGETQAAAASTLGITPQAASKRARVAGIRGEFAAVPALAQVLGLINGA